MRYLRMAALAVAGILTVGCGNEDNATEQPASSRTVTLTTTISLGGGTETRALDAAGHKTFAAGDRVAIIYKNTNNETVKAVSDALTGIGTDISANGKTARITVTLTNPKSDGQLYMIYPAAMASPYISQYSSFGDNLINMDALNEQDGTLTSLAANYDLATYDGHLTSDAKLPASVQLSNRLAICEFSVKESAGSTDITSGITLLNVANGDDCYTVRRTVAAGPIYVAMRPVTTGDINIFATNGMTDYRKTVTSPTLNANTMYPVNLTMNAVTDGSKALERLTSDYQAQNGDVLRGMLLKNVKISIANGATVTLAGVSINGVNDDNFKWAGITCEGGATITLADGTTNTVRGFKSDYPGIYVPESKRLTIQGDAAGTGALIASSNNCASGIGGAGNITITGGHITATGGENSAGIGSCPLFYCGNITISGGTITAIGGHDGAGIGSSENRSCGYITISGGTITANGGSGAAGIGSGSGSGCGDITISGGNITATGGSYAAGIGTGKVGECGNITITKPATVTATRGYGSPHDIGAGPNGNCGTVSIEGVVNMHTCTFTLNYYQSYIVTNNGVLSTSAYNVNEKNEDITITVNVGGNNYSVTGKFMDNSEVTIDLPSVIGATLTVTSPNTGYDTDPSASRPYGQQQPKANFVGTLNNVTIDADHTSLGTVILIMHNP